MFHVDCDRLAQQRSSLPDSDGGTVLGERGSNAQLEQALAPSSHQVPSDKKDENLQLT